MSTPSPDDNKFE